MTKNSTSQTLPKRRRFDSSLTAGRREADVLNTPNNGDVSVRELLVAGGFRGLTVREMFA